MKFDHMTDAQKVVFEKAKAILEKKPWYRGVCTDNYPPDSKCIADEKDAIASVVMETMYWDAPNSGFGE